MWCVCVLLRRHHSSSCDLSGYGFFRMLRSSQSVHRHPYTISSISSCFVLLYVHIIRLSVYLFLSSSASINFSCARCCVCFMLRLFLDWRPPTFRHTTSSSCRKIVRCVAACLYRSSIRPPSTRPTPMCNVRLRLSPQTASVDTVSSFSCDIFY